MQWGRGHTKHSANALSLWGALASGALAQDKMPVTMTIRVEQPALTGMPIWLHVLTRDACLEHATPPFTQDEYLWLRSDGPEMTRDGKPFARTSPVDNGARDPARVAGLTGCPESKVTIPANLIP